MRQSGVLAVNWFVGLVGRREREILSFGGTGGLRGRVRTESKMERRKWVMRQLSMAGLVLVMVVGVAISSQGQSLTAQQIVDRSIAVYANCNSYVDEGEVRTIFLEANGPRTVSKPFTTAFVRPSDFRFEYKARRGEEEWSSYIIWKDAESLRTWWSIKPGIETPPSLAHALGAAAGVSNLASVTVPTLLMPETRIGNEIKSLSALKLLGEEEINGRPAYQIQGAVTRNPSHIDLVDVRSSPVTFWLDKESLLIVKIFRTTTFPDSPARGKMPARTSFETETTTTYRPQINAGAEGKLAFNPPVTGKRPF